MIQQIVNIAAFLLAWMVVGEFARYFGMAFTDYLAWTLLVSGAFIVLCLAFMCLLVASLIGKALWRKR